jgi:hypothetical protein
MFAPCTSPCTCTYEVVFVLFAPIVLNEEDVDGAPLWLYCIGVGTGVVIDEMDGVVKGAVRETLWLEIAVRSPIVTDDHSAWFDSVTYNGHQAVSC